MRPFVLFAACAWLCACAATPPARTPKGPESASRPALILPVAEELAIGDPSARIGLVVISDFQCPYCRRLHDNVLPEVKARYVDTGLVRLYHKDFPLPMHRQAFAAAVAARCAARQGRLAAMQDALYRARLLEPSFYSEAARTIGLDRAAFEACMQNPSVRAVINRDRMELLRLGVGSTPTVVLGPIENGTVRIERMAKGTPTVEQFTAEIEALLAR